MEHIGRVWTPEGDFMGIDWASGNKGEKTRRASTKANEPGGEIYEKRKAEAEATILAEQQTLENKRSARSRLLAESTSGFGANTNVARSFLTSL